MELYKRTFSLLAIILLPLIGVGQELKSNLFSRTPQVVNYNFNQNEIAYSPIISVGVGISHKSKFIELATYVSDDDIYGFYTFFGTTLTTKEIGGNWKLFTNWFGEVTYTPMQDLNTASFIYTTGICFFLNHGFDWGSLGIPLCLGIAYNDENISLNTRTIFNLSININ